MTNKTKTKLTTANSTRNGLGIYRKVSVEYTTTGVAVAGLGGGESRPGGRARMRAQKSGWDAEKEEEKSTPYFASFLSALPPLPAAVDVRVAVYQ